MRDQILTVLKEYLAVDVQADEWDECPSLVLILRDPEGVPTFDPMPVDENVWGIAPVHAVLGAVTETTKMFSLNGHEWLSPGEELLGVALFSEGWGVSTTVAKHELEAVEAYMRSGGRLADHPMGKECKMVNAVLMDDTILMLTYFRDGELLDMNAEGTVEGRIPDGLRALLAAFQARVHP